MFSNLFWRRFTDKETEVAIATRQTCETVLGQTYWTVQLECRSKPFRPEGWMAT